MPKTTGSPPDETSPELNMLRMKVVVANAARPSGPGLAIVGVGIDAPVRPSVGSSRVNLVVAASMGSSFAVATRIARDGALQRGHVRHLTPPRCAARHAARPRGDPGAAANAAGVETPGGPYG